MGKILFILPSYSCSRNWDLYSLGSGFLLFCYTWLKLFFWLQIFRFFLSCPIPLALHYWIMWKEELEHIWYINTCVRSSSKPLSSGDIYIVCWRKQLEGMLTNHQEQAILNHSPTSTSFIVPELLSTAPFLGLRYIPVCDLHWRNGHGAFAHKKRTEGLCRGEERAKGCGEDII